MADVSVGVDHLGREYGRVLREVMASGDRSAPRGMEIIEARPLTIRLADPRACVVKRPGMSRAFMFAEQLLLLSGEHDAELLGRYSKRGAQMLNHYGAYGPRIRDQLPEVVRELRHDPDSRRAAAYVCRSDDLKWAHELNSPCTLAYHFFLRGGVVECVTYMRSWDLVWGLSYDVPNAAQLQMCVAADLGAGLGPLTFVAGSGHVYERHYGLEAGETDYLLPSLAGTTGWTETLDVTIRQAKRALECEQMWPGGLTPPDTLPQQWEGPFAVFARSLEPKA